MNIHKGFVAVLLGLTIVSFWLIAGPRTARATGETCPNGSLAPCAEDQQLDGCTACHSVRVIGGNRNGTDRIIAAATGAQRHIADPRMADWTNIVQSMVNKGSPVVLGLTAGYLNTNYCIGCTGPILGSPAASGVTVSGATLTWSTSYSGFEDEPTDTALFYGDNETDVLNCTNLTGCPGVNIIYDGSLVAHHVVNVAGLIAGRKYFVVNQATSPHGTARSLYTVSFRVKNCAGSNLPPRIFLSNIPSVSGGDTASVIAIDPAAHIQLTSIPVKGSPGELVAHPDGQTVYVTVDSNLSIIDVPGTAELMTQIGVGGLFNHVAMSPDGSKLYLAYRKSTGSATLQVKVFDTSDPSTPVLMTTINNPVFDGCYGPLGLGINPDGGRLYLACRPVSSSLPDRFYIIDTATATPTQTATFPRDSSNYTFINAIAVKPDGSTVYLARTHSSGSTIEVFNGVTGAHTGAIALPSNALPRAAVLTPDGSKLYVVDQRLGTHVINTATNTLQLTMSQTNSRGFDIAMLPDGNQLYAALLSNVFVLDAMTDSWSGTITGNYTAAYQIIVTPPILSCVH